MTDKKAPILPADELSHVARTLMADLRPPKPPADLLLRHAHQLIADMPPREAFVNRSEDVAKWFGEACAIVSRWDKHRLFAFQTDVTNIGTAFDWGNARYSNALALLHEIRFDIELNSDVSSAVLVDKGKVHTFYEVFRPLVAQAKSDLLLVDRHLNAEFVRRYFPSLTRGTSVRMLVRKPDHTLLPAVGLAAIEYAVTVEVRANSEVHDRFVFIDKSACHLSGASFADGAEHGPSVIAPILDFAEILTKYERMWNEGRKLTES